MRGNLLDVLHEQYVQTARAKGLPERVVINKHSVRIAINPLVSLLGMQLPFILSGEILGSIVLNLPTMGPLLYNALLYEDFYVSGAILMFMAVFLVVGNLVADIILAWIDPRIRYE
jgi:peptide/nickel transport system permease protein